MRNKVVDALHLQAISSQFTAGEITRDQARSAVMDCLMLRLQCSRVSLWRFDGEPHSLTMLCFAAKAVGGELVTDEERLDLADYRAYFNALINKGAYVSNDTLHDVNLHSMRATYLERHSIMAMLDVPFSVNGRVYGMACCEQVNSPRVWRADELSEVRAIVSKVTMLMASGNDSALMGSPSLPMTPLPANLSEGQQADLKRVGPRRR